MIPLKCPCVTNIMSWVILRLGLGFRAWLPSLCIRKEDCGVFLTEDWSEVLWQGRISRDDNWSWILYDNTIVLIYLLLTDCMHFGVLEAIGRSAILSSFSQSSLMTLSAILVLSSSLILLLLKQSVTPPNDVCVRMCRSRRVISPSHLCCSRLSLCMCIDA